MASSSSSSSSSPASSSSAVPSIDDFLHQASVRDREVEIDRVLHRAFKLNPFDVLDVSPTATNDEITRQYRKLSLLVHPDKASDQTRDDAIKAFQQLAASRDELFDEQKRAVIQKIVDEARAKLQETRDLETKEFQKTFKAKNPSLPVPPMVWPLPFEQALKEHIKEGLLDAEWRRRQLLKMAAKEEGRAEQEAERRKAEREAKEKADKEWEDGRDKRVASWRDFTKNITKKRKLMPRKTPDAVKKEIFHSWEEELAVERAEARKAERESSKWA